MAATHPRVHGRGRGRLPRPGRLHAAGRPRTTVAAGAFELHDGVGQFSRMLRVDFARIRGARLVTPAGPSSAPPLPPDPCSALTWPLTKGVTGPPIT